MSYKPFDYDTYKPVLLDSTGRKLTIGLFEELADPGSASKPVFKLSDWRKVYVDIADPTGYEAHIVLIGNWEHWQALVENKRFAAELEKWNKEVEIKLRSQAIKNLVKQSKTDKGTAAAKWLAEAGYAPKQSRKKQQTEEDGDSSRVSGDLKRLGIHAVK